MLTYFECQNLMKTARNPKNGKPLANNTRLFEHSFTTREGHKAIEGYGVVLWNTEIVKIKPDGLYILNTGGWNTVTTKDRINRYAPCNVFQKNHNWYVIDSNGRQLPFREGIELTKDGFTIKELLFNQISA